MKALTVTFCFSLLLFGVIMTPATGHAASGSGGGGPAQSVPLNNPLGNDAAATSPQALIGRVISFVLGIVGSLALLMFIYGGFLWMTSAGKDEKVEKGKQILIWTTAGLALIFLSYALVNFIITQGLLGG